MHIAAWPSFSVYDPFANALGAEVNNAASRIYAVEGGCFVLGPCATVSQEMIDDMCDSPEKHAFLHTGGGHAVIYGPDGGSLVDKLAPDEEGILYAEIDLAAIAVAKNAADPAGHYSRPDATRLLINKKPARRVEYFSLPTDSRDEDAAAIREPVITIIRDLDPDLQVVALGGEIFPGQPGSVLAVRDAVRRAHPQAIATLIALHIEATALLTDDPKRAAASVHKYIGAGLTDLATLERAVSASKFIADPDLIREAVEKMQIFQKSIGSLPQTAPLQELFDSSVYRQAMGGRG